MKNITSSDQYAPELCLPMITVEQDRDFSGVFQGRDFQRIMLETVDETLSLLGEKARQSIYFQLERIFRINRRDIPFEVEKFTEALEEIIGPGARLVEIEIMRHLFEKVGPKFKYSPKKSLVFKEYVRAVRAFVSTGALGEKPMPNEYYRYKFC